MRVTVVSIVVVVVSSTDELSKPVDEEMTLALDTVAVGYLVVLLLPQLLEVDRLVDTLDKPEDGPGG